MEFANCASKAWSPVYAATCTSPTGPDELVVPLPLDAQAASVNTPDTASARCIDFFIDNLTIQGILSVG